jgi:hypothetical protein
VPPSPSAPKLTELLNIRLEREVSRRFRELAYFEGITASAAARRLILREVRKADRDDDRRAS